NTATNLTLAGGATVNLLNPNRFGSGTVALDGVSLNLGSTAAIGTGTFTFTNGGLSTNVSGGILINNAVTFNNANVNLSGSTPLLFSGSVTLAGSNNRLNITNSATTGISGIIANAAGTLGTMTKNGTGTLLLTNNASTYTGLTLINAGIVQIQGA